MNTTESNKTSSSRSGRPTTGKSSAGVDLKKRQQNRNSQRSFRDKQQSYIQYLESVVAAVQAHRKQSDSSEEDGQSKLLYEHLDLLEKHNALQITVVELRQKLLSISQSAANAVESIKADVQPPDPQKLPAHISSAAPSRIIPEQGPTKWTGVPRHSKVENPILENSDDVSIEDILFSRRGTPPDERKSVSTSKEDHTWLDLTSESPFLSADRGQVTISPKSLPPFPIPRIRTEPGSQKDVKSMTVFADKVQSVCKRYLEMQMASQAHILAPVCFSAIKLIASLSGLHAYIYGSQFHDCLQHILKWRLEGTVKARSGIPEPFTPTPLQYTSAGYPIIIDFITWPSIRDQMILLRDQIDVDRLCRDLTLHTVIDVPEMSAAVPLYNYLKGEQPVPPAETIRAPAVDEKSCLEAEEWTYVHVPQDSRYSSRTDPTEDIIMQELAQRLSNQLHVYNHEGSGSSFGSSQNHQPQELSRCIWSSSHIEISAPSQWKLSKEFASQWPLIDCSGIVSEYESVPSSFLSLMASTCHDGRILA